MSRIAKSIVIRIGPLLLSVALMEFIFENADNTRPATILEAAYVAVVGTGFLVSILWFLGWLNVSRQNADNRS